MQIVQYDKLKLYLNKSNTYVNDLIDKEHHAGVKTVDFKMNPCKIITFNFELRQILESKEIDILKLFIYQILTIFLAKYI